jgi:hypothetical protein
MWKTKVPQECNQYKQVVKGREPANATAPDFNLLPTAPDFNLLPTAPVYNDNNNVSALYNNNAPIRARMVSFDDIRNSAVYIPTGDVSIVGRLEKHKNEIGQLSKSGNSTATNVISRVWSSTGAGIQRGSTTPANIAVARNASKVLS